MPASPALASGGTVLDPLPTTIDTKERRERLGKIATEIRRNVVEMIGRARLGHIGGDLSATDTLATLFFAVLRVDPQAPKDAEAGPIHPQQGPLRGGALFDPRPARLFPDQ